MKLLSSPKNEAHIRRAQSQGESWWVERVVGRMVGGGELSAYNISHRLCSAHRAGVSPPLLVPKRLVSHIHVVISADVVRDGDGVIAGGWHLAWRLITI